MTYIGLPWCTTPALFWHMSSNQGGFLKLRSGLNDVMSSIRVVVPILHCAVQGYFERNARRAYNGLRNGSKQPDHSRS